MRTSDRWLLAQWILIGLLGLSLFAPRSPQLSWGRIPGAALTAAGFLVVVIAGYTYGKVNRALIHASPDPDPAASMVDVGIYSWVRHPVYTGVILGSFGLALLRGSFWTIAVAAVLSLFYYLKSRYEETLLMRAFPGYSAYRLRAGRLVPNWIRRRHAV